MWIEIDAISPPPLPMQLRSRLDRVIPALAQAVDSIVTCSRNQEFRDQCNQVLQVSQH